MIELDLGLIRVIDLAEILCFSMPSSIGFRVAAEHLAIHPDLVDWYREQFGFHEWYTDNWAPEWAPNSEPHTYCLRCFDDLDVSTANSLCEPD